MLEYSANTATREAIARAHAERGKILRQAWAWLFHSNRKSRAAHVPVAQ